MQVWHSGKRLWSDGPSFRYSRHPWWHDCCGRLWKQSNSRLLICVWIRKKLSQGNSSKRKWKNTTLIQTYLIFNFFTDECTYLFCREWACKVKFYLPHCPPFHPQFLSSSPSQHTHSSENFYLSPHGVSCTNVLLCTLGGLCGIFCRLKPKRRYKFLFLFFLMEKMVVGIRREFVFLTILQFCGWGHGRGIFFWIAAAAENFFLFSFLYLSVFDLLVSTVSCSQRLWTFCGSEWDLLARKSKLASFWHFCVLFLKHSNPTAQREADENAQKFFWVETKLFLLVA